MKKTQKRRMKPTAFIRRYGKVMLGGAIIAAVVFCSIFAPLLTDYDPEKVAMSDRKQLPSEEHLLGTDNLGRDIWARLL